MFDKTDSCGCNDYSKLTSRTGIANLSAANSNRDGTGTIVPVISGAVLGTKINMIKIVATAPTTTGMIRLFIANKPAASITDISLYAEIPIPTYGTGGGLLSMFDVTLESSLFLKKKQWLYASTENAETFNVFAEGFEVDYAYPLPPVCCNFIQLGANTGLGTVSTANTNLDGTGAIVPIFTADAGLNGANIRWITINALQSTSENMLRLFLSSDGGITYNLIQEIWIPPTNLSSTTASFKIKLEDPISTLEKGYILGASTHISESFAFTVEGDDWSYPI